MLEQRSKLDRGGVCTHCYTHPAPAIDLPRFKMSGRLCRSAQLGTHHAYAGGVALAATWDPGFALKLGESLAKTLAPAASTPASGPGVNIARSPHRRRNFEYLSEDPYLNSNPRRPLHLRRPVPGRHRPRQALRPQQPGVQPPQPSIPKPTSAPCAKSTFPPLKPPVTKGHVDAVMKLLQPPSTASTPRRTSSLNLKVLKGEWGFQGILMSDWDATYDTVGAANKRLDLELPGPRFMNPRLCSPPSRPAPSKSPPSTKNSCASSAPEHTRYGFLDPSAIPILQTPTYFRTDRAVAMEGALKSITLSSRRRPICSRSTQASSETIAHPRPNAWPAVPGGGARRKPRPSNPSQFVTGHRQLRRPRRPRSLFPRTARRKRSLAILTGKARSKVETFPKRRFHQNGRRLLNGKRLRLEAFALGRRKAAANAASATQPRSRRIKEGRGI